VRHDLVKLDSHDGKQNGSNDQWPSSANSVDEEGDEDEGDDRSPSTTETVDKKSLGSLKPVSTRREVLLQWIPTP
jgi:hypothetical protein